MDKHYSIDPGMGSKMEGCPYSTFEDGRDVRDYIIPPKGYEFVGFKLEPLPNNQVYDGKLVAQYEKSSIKEILTMNIWKIMIPIIIVAVIALVVLLAVSIFKDPKPAKTKPTNPQTETVAAPIDTTSAQVSDTIAATETIIPENNGLTSQLEQKDDNQTVEELQETPQAVETETSVQFKQTFWELIHEGVVKMDPYHDLFVNNKGNVEGEEYDYLRFTILENSITFKEWSSKLRQIPAEERKSIQSIDALVKKLKEI